MFSSFLDGPFQSEREVYNERAAAESVRRHRRTEINLTITPE